MAYQPKSYRKFIATAATATIVASAVAPAASAASVSDFKDVAPKYLDAVSYLVANGITQGTTDTTFGTHDNVKRGDAAIWLAKALKLDLTNVPASGFTDTGRYDAAVSALKSEGVLSGKTATTFAPNALLTRGEMAKILANAYELTSDTDVPFTDLGPNFGPYIKALYEYEVTQGKTATTFGTSMNITRGDLAIFLKRAAEVVKTPEVKTISAVNAKEIVVDFNKNMDSLTAEDESNYEIKVNNGSALSTSSYTVELHEDDESKAVITLADGSALANGAYLSVKVKKNVVDDKLAPIADTTKTFTFVDNAAPTVTKVEVDGDDLKVTFDDYINSVGLVNVNGVNKSYTVSSAKSKTVTVTDGAKNLGNGTHVVSLANVVDITNNKSVYVTGSFSINVSTVAPVVTKTEKVSSNSFKIVFDKAVTEPTVTVKKNGLDLTTSVAGSGKEYVVTVSDNGGVKVYNTDESSVNVIASISAFKSTSDNLVGNAATASVTLTKDTTGPSVQTRFNKIVDADSGVGVDEVFSIKFDEVIKTADKNKIVLTDKNGVRKDVDSATIVTDADGNTVLQVKASAIQTDGVIASGSYTLVLAEGTVTDSSSNKNSATTLTMTKGSSNVGDLSVSASVSGNVITIPYGTDMTSSAVNLANYKLNNQSLPNGTVIYFSGSKETVKIELPAGSVTNSGNALLSITDVVAENGAKLSAASANQVIGGLTDNVKPTLVSAKKVSSTSVELTFSEGLSALSAGTASNILDDFKFEVNGLELTPASYAAVSSGNNKVVFTVAPYNTTQTLTVKTAKTGLNITDVAGNALTADVAVTAGN
ncbi:S-layer homology domain-containing protein [Bacillus sp. AG4(2022)]|uniref:S-layer homology domain-containing protein n=1 Tax=Bacillus sp. AG4(2022) TaxID=2962594 RepID=UPI002881D119|nr:S-layer homology domain-containing protein [Bacillus sp. AG4(2022)]MDT0161584.1 S-layer homology domain-containing protein [Bacillus sp. AG4(2022)]